MNAMGSSYCSLMRTGETTPEYTVSTEALIRLEPMPPARGKANIQIFRRHVGRTLPTSLYSPVSVDVESERVPLLPRLYQKIDILSCAGNYGRGTMA